MATSTKRDIEDPKGQLPKNTPPIVSQHEWESARQELLVKEKALTHASVTRWRRSAGGCRGWPWRKSTSSTDPRAG